MQKRVQRIGVSTRNKDPQRPLTLSRAHHQNAQGSYTLRMYLPLLGTFKFRCVHHPLRQAQAWHGFRDSMQASISSSLLHSDYQATYFCWLVDAILLTDFPTQTPRKEQQSPGLLPCNCHFASRAKVEAGLAQLNPIASACSPKRNWCSSVRNHWRTPPSMAVENITNAQQPGTS